MYFVILCWLLNAHMIAKLTLHVFDVIWPLQTSLYYVFTGRSKSTVCSTADPSQLCVHRQIQVNCVFTGRSKSTVCSPADPSQLCVHLQIQVSCVFTGRSKSAVCSPADPSQLCVHRQIQVNCVFTRRFKLTKVIGFSKSCMGCQVNNNLWKLVPETL